jgi:DNA polymerase
MINCSGTDKRARGLFQFYGANRTGRWAGRLIQLQNLPQNHIDQLAYVRSIVKANRLEDLELMYDNISTILSQLIRTAFVAEENNTFVVADFSAIEARVISWYADEDWRMEVFRTHGKIYEATASRMFNLPIEMITKGSDLRQKGKVAELALGYQGAVGALERMGGASMGLSEPEMRDIIRKWRLANSNIVDFWNDVEACAVEAVQWPGRIVESAFKGLLFQIEGFSLTLQLPSGRKLFYHNPRLRPGKGKKPVLHYEGIIQETKQWGIVDTYGGKLVENIVQATARDLLGYSMMLVDKAGLDIVMHVHDEIVVEAPKATSTDTLKLMCDLMGEEVPWAQGLPLRADGYITDFYKKD